MSLENLSKIQLLRQVKGLATVIAIALAVLIPVETSRPTSARAVGGWNYVYYANNIPTALPLLDRWTFQKDPDQGKGSYRSELAFGQLHVTNVAKAQ
jgi:hypothetical protein